MRKGESRKNRAIRALSMLLIVMLMLTMMPLNVFAETIMIGDQTIFEALLLNGAIEEVERSRMQIAGLLHYGDEVQRIYADKQALKPSLVKSLLHI